MSQAGYQSAVELVRSQVRDRVLFVWRALPAYRDADVDAFVERIVPLVQGGQLHVANLTAAYFESGAADQSLILDGRGVPAVEVYRRPAVEVYTALSEGVSYPDAVERGAVRLADLVLTDMQMAKVRQADVSLQARGATYFRRVLTGLENCALCVVASTQRYRVGALSPIHPGCDCGVEEIPSGWSADDVVIAPELLERTYAEIATRLDGVADNVTRDAMDLELGKTTARGRRVSDFTDLIVTREHGEYGPTLAWRDHKFTSAEHIAALV